MALVDLEQFDEDGNKITQKKREMSDFQVIKRIVGLVSEGRYRKYIIFLFFIMAIGVTVGFINPLIFQNIIDKGLGGGQPPFDVEQLYYWGGFLALIMFIGFLTWVGQQYVVQYLAYNVMFQMRRRLFENLQKLSFDYYDSKDRSPGKVISYITNDTETIQELISSGLLNIIADVFRFTGSIILMFVISVQLSLVSLGIIAVIVVMGLGILLKARKYFVIMRRKIAKVTGNLQESISGMRVIKAFAIEKEDYNVFDKNTDEELTIELKAQKLFAALPGLIMAVLGSGMAIMLLYGAWLQITGVLQTGQIFAFVLYLIQFFGPVVQIVGFVNQIQNSMAAGERVIKLVDLKPSVTDRIESLELTEDGQILSDLLGNKRKTIKAHSDRDLTKILEYSQTLDDLHKKLIKNISENIIEIHEIAKAMELSRTDMMDLQIEMKNYIEYKQPIELIGVKGHLEFRDVKFSYIPEYPVIKGLTMDIKEKERVAIVGYTGAGKSTLINLLGRFYDVTDGSILVDGYDVRDIKISSLRKNMGMVLQDNFLFSGSVIENIRYGRRDATDEEVMAAAKKVGAHEFIIALPNGYQTQIEERGNLLSIGQKQLIAFARALIRDPPLLILDEATSAVDPYSELIIQQALEVLLKNRTSISIAHRLSTIINSDRIFVLQDGQIVEAGSHVELVKKKGLYYQLYTLQYRDAYKEGEIERKESTRNIISS
jgi:ATP-binding cassette subfamily B multidrug efflux pump